MMLIKFPDGSEKQYEKGITPKLIAEGISMSLAKKALAAVFNGEYVELSRPLNHDGTIEILTEKDPRILDVINHSTAHLMAQAIKRLYPKANFGVGPAIEEGFYYDVDFYDDKVTDADLVNIEKEMLKLAEAKYPIIREELNYADIKKRFKDDPYKLELIEEHKDDILSIYTQGEFTDLCRGGHVEHTGYLKHFKLLNLAGAYWRGNSDNKMLVRIYGTSFLNKKI